MASQIPYTIVILLLSINLILAEPANNSTFTDKFLYGDHRVPFKLKNDLKFLHDHVLTSRGTKDRGCKVTPYGNDLHAVHVFGNGKLLLIGNSTTHFNVIDFKNCSSFVSTYFSYGEESDIYSYTDTRLESVVTYNDTFDVFDYQQKICMPCRYNDKGERLQVAYRLDKEPTGLNSTYMHRHDGYSLELVEDAFGVKNGYFYIFKYVNGSTALKILDSKFSVVKQRLFYASVKAHSLTHENLTVCYVCETPNDDPYGVKFNRYDPYFANKQRFDVCCHLLDSNLTTAAEVKLHQPDLNANRSHAVEGLTVRNLAGGGAMVAMDFTTVQPDEYYYSVRIKDVFVQRIHPNGRVDSAVRLSGIGNDYIRMFDFTFDNGEYCLVAVEKYERYGRSYTFGQCLKPSPPDYEKL